MATKLKTILTFFFVFFFTISSTYAIGTSESDCINYVLSQISDNISINSYSDFTSARSGYKPWMAPMDSLSFTDELVSVKVAGTGNFTTDFNLWSGINHDEYNIFTMYSRDPGSGIRDFSGCGYIKVIPLGAYIGNEIDIENSNYGEDDRTTFTFSVSNPTNYLRAYHTVESEDTSGNPFVKWEVLRLFLKDNTLYFEQHEVVEDFYDAIDDFNGGILSSINNYQNNLVDSGEPFTNFLTYQSNYIDLPQGIVNNISGSITPLPIYPPAPIPVTFTAGAINTKAQINDLISRVNSNTNELRFGGNNIVSDYNYISSGTVTSRLISLIPGGNVLITNDPYNDLDDSISANLGTISRARLDANWFANDNTVVLQNQRDSLINNYNYYEAQKYCTPADFTCSGWSAPFLGTTTRTVTRHRDCIGDWPVDSAPASWHLYKIKRNLISINDCPDPAFESWKKVEYDRATLGTSISDLCGQYSAGQYIGHQRTDVTPYTVDIECADDNPADN